MSEHDDGHMRYLRPVAEGDVVHLEEKERTYRGSWKRRGGPGAFMMLARKWDRLEEMMRARGYRILELEDMPEKDRAVLLDQIGDLRRYLLLVEAELVSRGVAEEPHPVHADATEHGIRAAHERRTSYGTLVQAVHRCWSCGETIPIVGGKLGEHLNRNDRFCPGSNHPIPQAPDMNRVAAKVREQAVEEPGIPTPPHTCTFIEEAHCLECGAECTNVPVGKD